MTKKYFIQFAAEIKKQVDLASQFLSKKGVQDVETYDRLLEQAKLAADIVCRVASDNNPNFDETRFLLACGL
jgi:hypothetical protein